MTTHREDIIAATETIEAALSDILDADRAMSSTDYDATWAETEAAAYASAGELVIRSACASFRRACDI